MTRHRILVAAALWAFASGAGAQTPARIRGTIDSVDGTTLHVAPTEGTDERLSLTPQTRVTLVEPTTLAAIQPGSFIGTAAKTQADGSLVAVEVHVFPESMRGAGEGHRPFDLGPTSTMTNGTVGQEVTGLAGQTLTVRYKGGEKAILVPKNVPVVAFAPGDAGMLTKGAHVIAFTETSTDGTQVTKTVLVGKDGLVPPL